MSQLTSFLDKDWVTTNISCWKKALNKLFHSSLSFTHFIFMTEDRILSLLPLLAEF